MDEGIRPESSNGVTPARDQPDTAINDEHASFLQAILQSLLFLVTVQTKMLAREQIGSSFFEKEKGILNEVGSLMESIKSLRNSVKVLEGKDPSIQALDQTIEFLAELQERIDESMKSDVMEEPKRPLLKFFSVLDEPEDLWGIIKRINELLSRYEHLSHLSLPTFWQNTLVELQKYSSADPVLVKRVIETPVIECETIIGKLLREAPCSGLLQVLKRRFESSIEMTGLLPEDQRNIEKTVLKHVENAERFREGILVISDLQRKAEFDLKNFNFGSGEMESRIPKVVYDVAKKLLTSAESLPPGDERTPHMMNAVSLFVALNQILVESPDLGTLLRELKI